MRNTNRSILVGVLLASLLFAGLLSGCQQTNPDRGQNTVNPAEVELTEELKSETWFQTYGGSDSDVVNDVLQAEDGGFYLLGSTNFNWEAEIADIYLIRTDKYGVVLWDKTLTSGSYALGQTFEFTSSGTILIGGIIRGVETIGTDIVLLEVDLDGNLLESIVIAGEMDEWVHTLYEVEDDGFFLFGNIVDPDDFITDPGAAGYGGFENRSSVYIARLDKSGEVIWTQNLDTGENVMSGGTAPAPDGGFFILANVLRYPELDDDLLLIKVDEKGNEIWSRTWDEGKITPRGGYLNSNGNLIIGAMYSASGDPRDGDGDYLVMELDSRGEEIWRTIFGMPGQVDILCGIIETEDNGYLLVGDQSPDLHASDSDLVLIKLDAQREILWEKVLDQEPHFMVSTLAPTDGGYIIAASFFRNHGAASDILLIKTDLKGDIVN